MGCLVIKRHLLLLTFAIMKTIRPVSYTHLDVYKRQDKGYPATMKVVYTFAEIQRQRERGVPQDELVTERTFTFWIDKNAFAQEEYENEMCIRDRDSETACMASLISSSVRRSSDFCISRFSSPCS